MILGESTPKVGDNQLLVADGTVTRTLSNGDYFELRLTTLTSTLTPLNRQSSIRSLILYIQILQTTKIQHLSFLFRAILPNDNIENKSAC